jgi:hypothetical protein
VRGTLAVAAIVVAAAALLPRADRAAFGREDGLLGGPFVADLVLS